jgi:hypothetical protein
LISGDITAMCFSFSSYIGNKNQNVSIVRGNRVTIGTTVIIDLIIQITATLPAWTHLFTWGQPITSTVNVAESSGVYKFQLTSSYIQTAQSTDSGTYIITTSLY